MLRLNFPTLAPDAQSVLGMLHRMAETTI